MSIKTPAILAATLMALAAPGFAQGMEGHNPTYANMDHGDHSVSKNDVSKENHRWGGSIHKPTKRNGIGKTPDGRTTFATTMESREIIERGPDR
ncbi:hypothetical protein LCGC14_0043480 [marine sediment metagenome]|uniref:Uncharacterized protein n=2 Tax=root TaxID=1 RepID=A0A7V1BIF5_9RHOB|nr:hypothetical protein [Sulfitobacter litoralis]HDZ53405.1 hypothetical protein [Sulfitobacter litoralis]